MNWLLILSFGILIYMHLESRLLFKSRVQIGNNNGNGEMLKIAHLSDLHIGRMFVSKKLIRKSIKKNSPDCFVLTGDYIEKKSHILRFIKFINYINPDGLPVYMVWGNHDHKLFKNEEVLKEFSLKLSGNSISVLKNQNALIQKGTKKYSIIGIDELFYGEPDIEKAFCGTEEINSKIVLTHNPDMLFRIADRPFDILLCGHFHGGQIYMPFDIEYKLFRHEKLAKMRIVKGLNEVMGHKLYINRGLGNVLLPFRFLSPPEIAFIEISS